MLQNTTYEELNTIQDTCNNRWKAHLPALIMKCSSLKKVFWIYFKITIYYFASARLEKKYFFLLLSEEMSSSNRGYGILNWHDCLKTYDRQSEGHQYL